MLRIDFCVTKLNFQKIWQSVNQTKKKGKGKMKNFIRQLEQVPTGTWYRLVFLVVSAINMGLNIFGEEFPIDSERLTAFITLMLACVVSFLKDNSFKGTAIKADEVMKEIRDEQKNRIDS